MCDTTMKNWHDMNFHILHPTGDGIHFAKLVEIHPSNISSHLLLAEIISSQISARTCHGQRVATMMLWGANQFAS